MATCKIALMTLFATLLFHAAPHSTMGEIRTFHFGGIVNYVTPQLMFEFSVGESVAGYFSFDTDEVDENSSSDRGEYRYGYVTPGETTIGGDYHITHWGQIIVGNHATDYYHIPTWYSVAPDLGEHKYVGGDLFYLTDTDGTVFDDDSLPLDPPPLDQFEGRYGEIWFDRDGELPSVRWTVTYLVPEPSGIILMSLAAAALMGFARRRRRKLAA